MKHNDLYLAWILLGGTAYATLAGSFDWPQWQGPDRNAISKETGLLQEWPKEGPPLAWKITGLGGGYSAPSIATGRIFGMSNRGGDEVVWALSEKDGKELWVTRLGPAITSGMPQGKEGAGCTPTVDGERLYVLGRGGDLACLQVGDGKIVWQRNLVTDLGGGAPAWKYNESPLVDGDKVICTPGGEEALLVALDKLTGEPIWKSKVSNGAEGGTNRGSGGGFDRGGANPNREERREVRGAPASPRAQPVIMIPTGSRWKYLDTGAFPGPDWTKLDFKDDAWPEGPAQLGYGDGDEKTRINNAPENYPTYYFRQKFEVKDPSRLKPLIIRLLRDDGAVVFINGVEVWRDNMPTGAVNHDSYAAGTDFAENEFHLHDLAPNQLVAGNNIIAVEVHQANANSSDVSFDLELREKVPATDVVSAAPAGRSIRWRAWTRGLRPGWFRRFGSGIRFGHRDRLRQAARVCAIYREGTRWGCRVRWEIPLAIRPARQSHDDQLFHADLPRWPRLRRLGLWCRWGIGETQQDIPTARSRPRKSGSPRRWKTTMAAWSSSMAACMGPTAAMGVATSFASTSKPARPCGMKATATNAA